MNRRDLLKTSATTAALSTPLAGFAAAGKVQAKKNLVIITPQMGFYDPFFMAPGGDLEKSELISILGDHFPDLTLLNNVHHPAIAHGHKGKRGVLTCNQVQSSGAYQSIDQLASDHIEQTTRFKHLNVAGAQMVWNRNSREVHSDQKLGPDGIYKKLFTKSADDSQLQREVETLSLLQSELAGQGRKSYWNAIEELEAETQTNLTWNRREIPKVEFDTALHLSDAHNRGYTMPVPQHLDLLRLAVQHQRAQIIVSDMPYIDKTGQLGVEGSYHSVGHKTSSKQAGQAEQLIKIERYLFNSFRDFLTSMKENQILDDTIVMLIGGFSDAGKHRREYIPTIVAGGGFKHQGFIECKENDALRYTLSDLYVTILHQMGIDCDEFAGDKGNLDHLLI